jgi:hypothetical protein
LVSNIDFYLLLGQIARNRSEIKLLNVFKGLPISYDVSINSIGDSGIQVHSNRQQIACLYHQRETYLQGEELPFILRSQVMSINLGKEDAVLANLEVAPISIGNRAQIRVEPDEPLLAVVKFDNSSAEFFVPIADISGEGAGIYFEHFMFPSRLCQPGSELSMTIWLPDTNSLKKRRLLTRPLLENRNTKSFYRPEMPKEQDGKVVITTKGRVASIHPAFQLGRYRVGLKLFFRDLSRTVILQYISQRQVEIIRDLSVLADELYSRKKTG